MFKSFDWEITNNSPSISSLFNTNNNDNEFIKRAVKLVYTALFINLIYVLGNLTFRKYRLVKTSIVLATLFVIIFLITLLFKKYEIKYSNTQSNILSSPYLLIAYLIILKTLIYLRFKKIQA
jgi:preprotein translocase subunit SecG